jgi:hypothetical protein
MSYCRFSDDDFQCDLYCYEHVDGGFITHVAYNRPKYKEPLPAPIDPAKDTIKKWLERHKKVLTMVSEAERISITLPHAGESFCDNTLEDFLARLIKLRELGYRFPDYVIERVKEELEEQHES